MTFRIQLSPSKKVFAAEKTETLLEAALRSGIALNYSCSSGACGGCGGRIISGQVRATQHHDFKFPEAQQAQGYVLLCCHAADSDLEIEVQEVGGVEDIPIQQIQTKVEKLERIQDDTMILHLRTPRSQTLRFLAGQHISLSIEGLQSRNKSLASCPCNAMNLQFHIRRVPGDPFSEYVFTQLKTSQSVLAEGPWGAFTLNETSKRPIIFIAYETGFAPIKSIIEHTFALEAEQPIHLYWMVRQTDKHYLQNLCRSWVDAMDNFKYTPLQGGFGAGVSNWEEAVSPELDAADMDKVGAAIVADFPDLSGVDVYLTAPDSGMARIVQILHQHGLPQAQLHQDVMQRF
jgi:CDP-4-dehydro-6-deoxyglucose reductase, E3